MPAFRLLRFHSSISFSPPRRSFSASSLSIIDKEHDELFERLRKAELHLARLRQRVYFISAGISTVVGAGIAIRAKLLGG